MVRIVSFGGLAMQAAAWGFGGCAGELRIVRAFDAMGAQPVSESEAHWFLRQLARDVMGRYALARLLDAAGQPARARSPEELERAGQAAIARGAVRVVRGGPPPRTHVASTGAARAAEVYEDEPVAAVAPVSHWIEIELVDDDGRPVPYARFELISESGRRHVGVLDDRGYARVEPLDDTAYDVTFPNLPPDRWGQR